jgi:hypothetical protein
MDIEGCSLARGISALCSPMSAVRAESARSPYVQAIGGPLPASDVRHAGKGEAGSPE